MSKEIGEPSKLSSKLTDKPNSILVYQYPRIFYKVPHLIRVIYGLNYLTQLRKWHIMQAWMQMLEKRKPDFTAIDIGSGEGQYIIPFCKTYPSAQFFALDNRTSNELFINAFKIKNLKSICLDIEKSAPETKADLAICIGVMPYLENDEAALLNIHHSLKDNGQFLLYLPINGHHVTSIYPYIFNRYAQYESVNNRRRVYQEREILSKLEAAGFRLTKKTYTFGYAGKLSHELTNSCTTLIFSAPWLLKIIAGLLLVVLFPFILLLMIIDFNTIKSTGNGVLLELVKS